MRILDNSLFLAFLLNLRPKSFRLYVLLSQQRRRETRIFAKHAQIEMPKVDVAVFQRLCFFGGVPKDALALWGKRYINRGCLFLVDRCPMFNFRANDFTGFE